MSPGMDCAELERRLPHTLAWLAQASGHLAAMPPEAPVDSAPPPVSLLALLSMSMSIPQRDTTAYRSVRLVCHPTSADEI